MVPYLILRVQGIIRLPVLSINIILPPINVSEPSHQQVILLPEVDMTLRLGHGEVCDAL